jgi:hypothetical protein
MRSEKMERSDTKQEIMQEIMQMIVDAMSEEKKEAFRNACARNAYFTSHYGMSRYTMSVYKQGYYFTCEGTRSGFSIWAWDRDGEIVIGRKPKKEKLDFLWGDSFLYGAMPKALEKIL